jgi:hypothetical protein
MIPVRVYMNYSSLGKSSDNFVTGMLNLYSIHHVADSPADVMEQWFNAGGMIQFYDYPLSTFLNVNTNRVYFDLWVQIDTLTIYRLRRSWWQMGLLR